jgi:phosphatidylinositol 3-kinase
VSLTSHSPYSDLYVTIRLWADSKPLTLPMQTSHKIFKNSRSWNEWLHLPVHYSKLPPNAQLAITVWDLQPLEPNREHATPFGGTTVPLFDDDNTLYRGSLRCKIHRFKRADGFSQTATPALPPKSKSNDSSKNQDPRVAEIDRIRLLMKGYEMGEIIPNRWLDQHMFRQVEKLERLDLKVEVQQARISSTKANSAAENDGSFYLNIEYPKFDHQVLFVDTEYPAPPISSMAASQSTSDVRLKPPPEVSFGPGIDTERDSSGVTPPGKLIGIYDPEVGIRDSPSENKHRRLVRNKRTGLLDRDLRPTANQRDQLGSFMSYGPLHELTSEQKDMIWKYRHYLTRDKRALTKFVKSVTWSDETEAREAISILSKWTSIDVDDALELLGPTFYSAEVRAYAVDRLRKAHDDELLLYLLQLVQALKFEQPVSEDLEISEDSSDSSLANFLISRAIENFNLGNNLHWYLIVECEDRGPQDSPDARKLYAKVEYDFMTALNKTPEGKLQRTVLRRQAELITLLSKISRDIRSSSVDRPRKLENLKKFLADPKNELTTFDPPLPLPLDPTVKIVGCYPEDSNVFKSTMMPLLITFRTSSGVPYPIIFKNGDDLRQDQLVIQIISLMDRLLQTHNLDLKLTPYRTLATSPTAGAVQFVPSLSLHAILAKHKSIQNYLKHHNPDPAAEFGVRKEAMDTYVRSCAGYCIITYILGVGDRHTENLLITPTGNFFHADFGYILGRDPKPFPPLMKLDPAMIQGMGGVNHALYHSFKQFCFTAFLSLRKSANLILNLFALMIEANIPDIRNEPDKAVAKVQERFHLELTESEAIQGLDALITESPLAMMPRVIDAVHVLMQGLRA